MFSARQLVTKVCVVFQGECNAAYPGRVEGEPTRRGRCPVPCSQVCLAGWLCCLVHLSVSIHLSIRPSARLPVSWLSFSHGLILCISLSMSVCLSVCLCGWVRACMSLSLTVSICLYLSKSTYVSFSLSPCHSVSLSLCLSVTLSPLSLCLSVTLCSLSLCLSVTLCLCPSVTLSLCLCHSVTLCLCPSVTLSLCLSVVPVSFSLSVSASILFCLSFPCPSDVVSLVPLLQCVCSLLQGGLAGEGRVWECRHQPRG